MITKVRVALAGTAVMAAVLMGCEETTPVRDVVSRTFTVKTADFELKVDEDRLKATARATYDMPEITADVVAAGTVTAEIDLGSAGAEWSALPLTAQVTHGSDAHVVTIQPRYREGEFILLLRADLQGTVDSIVAVDDYRLRVIVIYGDAADK